MMIIITKLDEKNNEIEFELEFSEKEKEKKEFKEANDKVVAMKAVEVELDEKKEDSGFKIKSSGKRYYDVIDEIRDIYCGDVVFEDIDGKPTTIEKPKCPFFKIGESEIKEEMGIGE